MRPGLDQQRMKMLTTFNLPPPNQGPILQLQPVPIAPNPGERQPQIAVRPVLAVTSIKQPTCLKQPMKMFPNVNFVLVFTSSKQPPALSSHFCAFLEWLLNTGFECISNLSLLQMRYLGFKCMHRKHFRKVLLKTNIIIYNIRLIRLPGAITS